MNSVKLSYKSFDELNALRLAVENNPTNRNTSGGWYIYNPQTRKKLQDLAWAVTYKLARGRKEVTNGISNKSN